MNMYFYSKKETLFIQNIFEIILSGPQSGSEIVQ